MPKVSVILTVFNNKDDVINSIESVINQSFKDWELIIVDDCSIDGSFEKIHDYLKKNNGKYNFKLIKNGKNYGTYVSKNIGIVNSQGEYLTFIDSDDTYHTDKLKKQVNILNTNDVQAVTIKQKNNEDIIKVSETMLMLKRSIIDKIGYYDSVRFGADWEYSARIRKVYGNNSIFIIDEVLYFVKCRDGSLTRNTKTGISGSGRKKRRKYLEGYTSWHNSGKNLYIPFKMRIRPFPVDKIMLP